MAYKNQNYMTNKKIKAEVDKNQKGYEAPSDEEENTVTLGTNTVKLTGKSSNGFIEIEVINSPDNSALNGQKFYIKENDKTMSNLFLAPQPVNDIALIQTKSDYNTQLADENSALNKYYTKYPREDAIDANGDPIRDPNTEVKGHSWESAITAPTDPSQTSSFPWLTVNMNNFTGIILVKYNNQEKLSWNVTDKSFGILSVPNDLNMTDYRLAWGTGSISNELDESLFEVIYIPKADISVETPK